MTRDAARLPSRRLAAAPGPTGRPWTPWRVASTLAFIALVFAVALVLDRWVPAPVWPLLNGLFWLAMLVSALGAILRRRRRSAVASPPSGAHPPHQR